MFFGKLPAVSTKAKNTHALRPSNPSARKMPSENAKKHQRDRFKTAITPQN
jgi:hypothetical protein